MCHLGTQTHATLKNTTGAAAAHAHLWHSGSPHAGWLATSRDHGWRRDADGALRTLAASLAAPVDDSCSMSWQPSPPAWAWPGGQRCERRRPGKHLLLKAGCSGGDRRPAFHDLVVQKCVLTAGLGEGNN